MEVTPTLPTLYNIDTQIYKIDGNAIPFVKIEGEDYKMAINFDNDKQLKIAAPKVETLKNINKQINTIFSDNYSNNSLDLKQFKQFNRIEVTDEAVIYGNPKQLHRVNPAGETHTQAWKEIEHVVSEIIKPTTTTTSASEPPDSDTNNSHFSVIFIKSERPGFIKNIRNNLPNFFPKKEKDAATEEIVPEAEVTENANITAPQHRYTIDHRMEADTTPIFIAIINGREYAMEVELTDGTFLDSSNTTAWESLIPQINFIFSAQFPPSVDIKNPIGMFEEIEITQEAVRYGSSSKQHFIHPADALQSEAWKTMNHTIQDVYTNTTENKKKDESTMKKKITMDKTTTSSSDEKTIKITIPGSSGTRGTTGPVITTTPLSNSIAPVDRSIKKITLTPKPIEPKNSSPPNTIVNRIVKGVKVIKDWFGETTLENNKTKENADPKKPNTVAKKKKKKTLVTNTNPNYNPYDWNYIE